MMLVPWGQSLPPRQIANDRAGRFSVMVAVRVPEDGIVTNHETHPTGTRRQFPCCTGQGPDPNTTAFLPLPGPASLLVPLSCRVKTAPGMAFLQESVV